MGLLGRKRESQPTHKEMVEEEQDAKFELGEGLPSGPPVDMIAFDFQVLDDEKILPYLTRLGYSIKDELFFENQKEE